MWTKEIVTAAMVAEGAGKKAGPSRIVPDVGPEKNEPGGSK